MSNPTDINNASAESFLRAIKELDSAKKLTATRRTMLLHHYSAPNHSISTAKLAELMAWPADTGNLQYGSLGGLFASFFALPAGSDKLHSIAAFDQDTREWVMRNEFVAAGRTYGLFPHV